MRSWIDHAGEVVWEPAPSLIAQLIEAGQPFWLDIENPTDEIVDQLAARLGLHPLAVEDSKQFGRCFPGQAGRSAGSPHRALASGRRS
jgi:magnesium transporter